MAHTLFVPLMLTLGAGLATGIGSTIALFAHRTNKRLLSFSLGLSGGVMIYVSSNCSNRHGRLSEPSTDPKPGWVLRPWPFSAAYC